MEELLSYQEADELLEAITINKKLYQASSATGPRFVVFSHPTPEELLHTRHRRELALIEARELGLPSLEELEKFIEEKSLRSTSDTAKIAELEEKIKAQRRVLQLTKIEGRRKPILQAIAGYEQEIKALEQKASALFSLSADRKADEESVLFLAWLATHTIEGEKYWSSFQEFENEKDLVFRSSVLNGFLDFNQGTGVRQIRFLARHNLWRVRYVAALKIGGKLFSRELSSLTPDQTALLYWSSYYQSIFEMLPDDQPDDDIIKDDEALDAFMDAYFKRREEERNEGKVKRRGGRSSKGKLSAWDKGEEVLVTAAHPEYMSIAYSDTKMNVAEHVSDVEVVAPNSRRARNRALARRNR